MKKNKLQEAAKISQKRWVHQEENLLNKDINKRDNNSIKYNPKKLSRIIIAVVIIIVSIIGACTVAKNHISNTVTDINDNAYISNTKNDVNDKLDVSLPDGWKCYDEKSATDILIKRYIKDDKYINITKYLSGSVNLDIEDYTLLKSETDTKIYQKEDNYKIVTRRGGYYYVIEGNSSLNLLLSVVKE